MSQVQSIFLELEIEVTFNYHCCAVNIFRGLHIIYINTLLDTCYGCKLSMIYIEIAKLYNIVLCLK